MKNIMLLLRPLRRMGAVLGGVVLVCLFYTGCRQNGEGSPAGPVPAPVPVATPSATNVDLSFLKVSDGAYLLPWKYLLRLTMDSVMSQEHGGMIELPVFNDTLKALDGKQVIVEGYYIPATETKDNQVVILSAYPFAQCFYCGKAGIESVIDVLSVKPLPRMKTDTKTKIRGRFRLNATNFEYLVFVLEESVLVKD